MKEGKLHGFQLWVNMPAKLKMSKPSYRKHRTQENIPEVFIKTNEKKIKIIAGKFQKAEGPITGPAKGFVDPIYLDIELRKERKNFIYTIPSSHNAFVYLVSGEITNRKQILMIRLENSTLILVGTNGSDSNCKFLLLKKVEFLFSSRQTYW